MNWSFNQKLGGGGGRLMFKICYYKAFSTLHEGRNRKPRFVLEIVHWMKTERRGNTWWNSAVKLDTYVPLWTSCRSDHFCLTNIVPWTLHNTLKDHINKFIYLFKTVRSTQRNKTNISGL